MKLMLDSVYEDIQRGECQMLIIYIYKQKCNS